jgi:SAM-dependent methyltransferase
VLDAGAGEAQYKHHFSAHRYCAFDLAVGDAQWDYTKLDARGDLADMPFRDSTFDACLSVVTLEHVREPLRVVQEMSRTLGPGGRLLLVAPLEWEVHQAPHDFFRYTRHGLEYLLQEAGFEAIDIRPVGGFFRLLSRRVFNAIQFFPGPLAILAAIFFAPAGLLLPLFDGLDRPETLHWVYMLRAQSTLILAMAAFATSTFAADFSGASALKFTREAVAFGPRPSGSEANRKLQAYIVAQLKPAGARSPRIRSPRKLPKGDIAMKNIVAKFPAKAERRSSSPDTSTRNFFQAGNSSVRMTVDLRRACCSSSPACSHASPAPTTSTWSGSTAKKPCARSGPAKTIFTAADTWPPSGNRRNAGAH